MVNKYTIFVAKRATADMESIFQYISTEFNSENSARNTIIKIREKIEIIGKNPFAYAVIDNPMNIKKFYRRAVVQNYIIYYRVNPQVDRIDILRVLYNKRNFMNLL